MKLCVLGVKRNFNSNKLRDNQKKTTKFKPYRAKLKVLVTLHVNLNLKRVPLQLSNWALSKVMSPLMQNYAVLGKKTDIKRRI